MKFGLHFVGINITRTVSSRRYYSEFLRMPMEDNDDRNIIVPVTTGMRIEIFVPHGRSPVFDHPVNLQAVRPCIHVPDLEKESSALQKKGALLGASTETTAHGRRMELIAPDGIRWLVASGRGFTRAHALKRPHVGSADLRARNLPAQLAFYRDILGLRDSGEHNGRTILRDRSLGTFLLVSQAPQNRRGGPESFPVQPAFLSLQTRKIKAAEEMLRARGVKVVQPSTEHYFGTDLLVLDADRNVVQIVEYP